MDFLEPESRELLRAAGADVRPGSERVRFDPAMVDERITTAPPAFTLHATNPAHTSRSAATGRRSGRSPARRTCSTPIAAGGSATGPTTRT